VLVEGLTIEGVDWSEVRRVVSRLSRTVRGYAVGDVAEFVEEVEGRVTVKLVRALTRTRRVRSLEAYVRVALHHTARDLRRDLLLACARVSSLDALLELAGVEVADSARSAEEAMLVDERCAARWRALERLGEAYPRGMRVLLMRHVTGRSASEVAALEGTSVEYVDQIVRRSRRMLCAMMRTDRVA
jgi:DNA-directed RNA polymerase specialized sigma24 family protein